MARKSRKETVAVIAPEVDNTCRAAIYVRLSVEDSHTRSASIETQQLIIARFLEQNGAARVCQQAELSAERLAATLRELLGDRVRRLRMAEAGRQLAKVEAAAQVATVCLEQARS